MEPLEPAAGDISASAIVGGTVAGRHLLHVEGYSHTKDLPNGKCIESCPFSVGGHSWCIEYFPNGNVPKAADFISIFLLYCKNNAAGTVKARARFSLLDQAGAPVASHSWTTMRHSFCAAARNWGYGEFIKRAWLEESKHLRDDRFTIRCDVIVTKELCAVERAPAPSSALVALPPSDLHRHLGDLMVSKEGTDVVFQVAGETFQAHRCVLAARSPVFKAELCGTMEEAAKGAVVCVDDMDAQVFRALLDFVYTDELPDFSGMEKQEESAMAQHLLVAADKYSLERLKLICEDRLCGHIDMASAGTILALAEQHHCPGLKEACFRFLMSPSTLNAVMATDGFDHLARSCPFVLKELMSQIAARVPFDLGEIK
ncbi:hypothetical protein ACP4OV_010835 [Aristida adscensionis]